jgi:hypothetical protein
MKGYNNVVLGVAFGRFKKRVDKKLLIQLITIDNQPDVNSAHFC